MSEIDQILSFFAPGVGVRVDSPASSSKVSGGEPPVIFNNTANLDPETTPMPLYSPTECDPRYMVLGCGCRRRIVPSTCMSLDCEICKPHVGKRRADKVLRRLLGGDLYQKRQYQRRIVVYTVFTVPMEMRESCLNKAHWQTLRRKAWKLLKSLFGAKYSVEVSHPQGDKDTTVFHPHLNFLWIQHPGHRPFIDVDLLRKKWAEVLNTIQSDVYSQYTNKIGRIIHWCKYVTRNFPGTHKWTGSLRWYGKYPKIKHPTDYVCLECNCKFHFIGWVSARDVDDYNERGFLMGLDPPWERDELITRARGKSLH